MSARPEPVEAYLLQDLPIGVQVKFGNGRLFRKHASTDGEGCYEFVTVVEWPQRTYDGIPADDLDLVVSTVARTAPMLQTAASRIRAAIAAQGGDQ